MILDDNIYFDQEFSPKIQHVSRVRHLFTYQVIDSERFGIMEFDDDPCHIAERKTGLSSFQLGSYRPVFL
ncbi:MAG: hypothetical protein HNEKOMLI_00344 [Sodalis sp. Psp]|nr:hypothetical protein [Sodalis sp. Psp]MCR3756834.1 hypothetical protein [Sodalis sp. Ppy]